MEAQIVSYHCVLKDRLGTVLGRTTNLNVITSIRNADHFPLKALAEGLSDLKKGEKRRISLAAAQAYGFYDPAKVILYPRSKFAKEANFQKHQPVTIQSKSGVRKIYRVLEIHKQMILLDGNHPLAGQDLVFEIETLDARAATKQEILDTELSSAGGVSYQ